MAKSDKSPFERLAEVRSFTQARKLHKELGDLLNRPVTQKGYYLRKSARADAKEVRRELEERYGDGVRDEAAMRVKMSVAGKTVVVPSWTQRSYFTVRKPTLKTGSRFQIVDPKMMFIPLDAQTLEPMGVYYPKPGDPYALTRAMDQLEDVRAERAKRKFGLTKEQRLSRIQQQIDDLKSALRTYEGLEDDPSVRDAMDRMKGRIAALEREKDDLLRKEKVQDRRGMGAGPDSD